MEQQPRRPIRRKRKVSRFQRALRMYSPTIILCVLCVVCVTAVVFTVQAISNISAGSGDVSIETPPTTTAPPPTAAPEEIQAALKEAEFIAAGYDYQRAIKVLKACEGYETYPQITDLIDQYTKLDRRLISYPDMDKITHIFFHSLIVDPERAFDGDEDEDGYNLYMATVSEFEGILQAMYDNGYVLVSPYDVAYEQKDGSGNARFIYGDIRLPEGKIPFLMSQDDVNYYSYMIGTGNGKGNKPVFADTKGDGFASKLVIGEDGYPTCEYMDKYGNVTTGDYDLVPILEKFIQAHPDFSYHGARAILGVTGYEGVLGYRTKPSYEETLGRELYLQEVEQAKAVAACLREKGWILASHSYGHPAYGNLAAENVKADSDKWEATCEYIIGPTDVILYPHGSDISGVKKYSMDNAKFAALYEDGYRYFFNVDSNKYWCQLGSNYFRGGRRNVDGYRMFHNPNRLADLFDVSKVFDPARPLPVPQI